MCTAKLLPAVQTEHTRWCHSHAGKRRRTRPHVGRGTGVVAQATHVVDGVRPGAVTVAHKCNRMGTDGLLGDAFHIWPGSGQHWVLGKARRRNTRKPACIFHLQSNISKVAWSGSRELRNSADANRMFLFIVHQCGPICPIATPEVTTLREKLKKKVGVLAWQEVVETGGQCKHGEGGAGLLRHPSKCGEDAWQVAWVAGHKDAGEVVRPHDGKGVVEHEGQGGALEGRAARLLAPLVEVQPMPRPGKKK